MKAMQSTFLGCESADTSEHRAGPGVPFKVQGAPKIERLRGKLSKVVDGDTIHVTDRDGAVHKIRLLSIDAPELHFFGRSQGRWGQRAADRLAELLPEKCDVEVVTDEQPYDAYGRILGYVYSQGILVNRQMLEDGLAVNYMIYPNLRYFAEFSAVAKHAILKRKGMFRDTQLAVPYEFRWGIHGRPHVTCVGSLLTHTVFTLRNLGHIDLWDRVFFLRPSDVHAPFSLARSFLRELRAGRAPGTPRAAARP